MDDPYYWMHLEDDNVADLLNLCSETIKEFGPPTESFLVGVVSEEDGGIIAYINGVKHANKIVEALNKMSKSVPTLTGTAYSTNNPNASWNLPK